MDPLGWFNAIEAAVWFVFGAGLFVASVWRPLGYRLGRVAAVAFLCFGASDLVEMQTGAWFRPWWLLAWKAACVATLLGTWWRYRVMLRGPSSNCGPSGMRPPRTE